jgi:hypothetical protein
MEPLMNQPLRRLAVAVVFGAVLLAFPRHAYAQG